MHVNIEEKEQSEFIKYESILFLNDSQIVEY